MKEKCWNLKTWNTRTSHQTRVFIFLGDSVKISMKNNSTDFGFSIFFAIYKRGNQNW